MPRNRNYVRKGLLSLMIENPEAVHEFTARFLTIKNESWITIGQLRVKESKHVIAGHLNLPVYKLTVDKEGVKQFKKGQLLALKAIITTYNSGGTLRATLKGFGSRETIEMIEVN